MIVIRENGGIFYPAGGRVVLHTPLKTFPKETKRHAKAQKQSFAASGGVWRAYAIRPYPTGQ